MAGMQVVLWRHGIARNREAFAASGWPDSERPLTDKGERRTRQAAGGLLSLLGVPSVIAASPYARARQTADVLARACEDAEPGPARATVDALQPGDGPGEVARWLAERRAGDTVVLVGHEPDLSELTAWFTAGERQGFARFKKAGACLIEFDSPPARRGGELMWLMPPGVLRRLAEA